MAKAINEKEEKKRRGCGFFGCLGIIILLIILIGSCAKDQDNDKYDKAATTIKQEETKKSEESKEDEKKQQDLQKQQEEQKKQEELKKQEAEQKKQQELQKQRDEQQKQQELKKQQEQQKKQESATQPKTNQVTEQNGTCTIKGNKNSRGEKIYHMPGQQFYDKTKAEEMFCSEADAKSAGYRASKK